MHYLLVECYCITAKYRIIIDCFNPLLTEILSTKLHGSCAISGYYLTCVRLFRVEFVQQRVCGRELIDEQVDEPAVTKVERW